MKKILSSQVLSILLRNSDIKYRFGACKCDVTDRCSASDQVNRSSVTFYLKIQYNLPKGIYASYINSINQCFQPRKEVNETAGEQLYHRTLHLPQESHLMTIAR